MNNNTTPLPPSPAIHKLGEVPMEFPLWLYSPGRTQWAEHKLWSGPFSPRHYGWTHWCATNPGKAPEVGPRTFQKDDIVRHRPTGETWILIRDELDGKVLPAGWPPSMADAKDCELVKAAPEATTGARIVDEHREQLNKLAAAPYPQPTGALQGDGLRRNAAPDSTGSGQVVTCSEQVADVPPKSSDDDRTIPVSADVGRDGVREVFVKAVDRINAECLDIEYAEDHFVAGGELSSSGRMTPYVLTDDAVAILLSALQPVMEAKERELIDERDHLEEVVDRLCAAVGHRNGFEFEWSSAYGFEDAVEDVEGIVGSLRERLRVAEEALNGARLAASQFDKFWQNAEAEATTLRATNAKLELAALGVLQGNGGPIQSEEAEAADAPDDYVMVRLPDFNALAAAIATPTPSPAATDKETK